jgi:hypothetical protein
LFWEFKKSIHIHIYENYSKLNYWDLGSFLALDLFSIFIFTKTDFSGRFKNSSSSNHESFVFIYFNENISNEEIFYFKANPTFWCNLLVPQVIHWVEQNQLTFKNMVKYFIIGNIWWWILGLERFLSKVSALCGTSTLKMKLWTNLDNIGVLIESNTLVLGVINLNMFLVTFMMLLIFLPIYSLKFLLGKLCYLIKL